jgi:hypothetical protein
MTENVSNEEIAPEIPQQKIPLANTTLVLAILSVVGCVIYGIPGVVLAILAIVFHSRIKKVYLTDPAVYRQSYGNARAGLIIAIISLAISVATAIYSAYVFYILWYVVQ